MAADDCTDRDIFGHWLSGLTDGEGCFYLGLHHSKRHRWPRPHAALTIELRRDDLPIVHEVQQFWGVGAIATATRARGKPGARFMVTKVRELIEAIIPHFDRYPLRSKKARDFVAFKQGVELLWTVQCRFRKRKPGRRGGRFSAWTEGEREDFRSIVEGLREGRKYRDPDELTVPSAAKLIEKQSDLLTY